MLVGHQHKPGVFDAGHCRACARHAGLLDHYWQVRSSRRPPCGRPTGGRVRPAGDACVALWSSGAAILRAAVAMLTG